MTAVPSFDSNVSRILNLLKIYRNSGIVFSEGIVILGEDIRAFAIRIKKDEEKLFIYGNCKMIRENME